MGDRAVIQLTDGAGEYSPALYLHSIGEAVPAILERFRAEFVAERGPDVAYGFARLAALACTLNPGVHGVGAWNQNAPPMTCGDAGVFLYDMTAGTVTQRDGYAPRVPDDAALKYVVEGEV